MKSQSCSPPSWFPEITPKLLMRQYWVVLEFSTCKEQPVLCLLLPKPGDIVLVMDKGEGTPKGPLVPGAGPQSQIENLRAAKPAPSICPWLTCCFYHHNVGFWGCFLLHLGAEPQDSGWLPSCSVSKFLLVRLMSPWCLQSLS